MVSKIDRLIQAMAFHEGWTPAGLPTNPNGSRSFRNHNPGNLRSSPFEFSKAGGYSVFKSDFIGLFAMEYDILQKARGKTVTGLNGESTLADLIRVWAPTEDNNDPQSYLNNICRMTGFEPQTKLKTFL